jgi:hypothetical protein
MPELSLDNIERISRDVRRQGITFSHLLEDLTDHICCDVENEMENGLTFLEAYRRVKQKMHPRRLKEIQEETLYSVDSKYRIMKNTMKISGVSGTILFGCAALFKIQHWPGAGIMLSLGALILAFVFMPSALGVLWKETHSKKRLFLFISGFLSAMLFIFGILFKIQHWNGAGLILILAGISAALFLIPALLALVLADPENKPKRPIYIVGAVGLILYVAGFLCKIMHWPGATILLMGGLLLLFVIVFPLYVRSSWKDEKFIKPEFIFLVTGSLAIILPSTLITASLQRSFDMGYYDNQEQQQALSNYIDENNSTYITQYRDSISYALMDQLDSRTNDILKLIGSIEIKMIGESEGEPGNPVENPLPVRQTENGVVIDFSLLKYPFHLSPVNDFLLPGTTSRNGLEAAIADYRTYLSGIVPSDVFIVLEKILDPSLSLPVESTEIRKISMMSGLHSLALLKTSLLTAESWALKYLTENK